MADTSLDLPGRVSDVCSIFSPAHAEGGSLEALESLVIAIAVALGDQLYLGVRLEFALPALLTFSLGQAHGQTEGEDGDAAHSFHFR